MSARITRTAVIAAAVVGTGVLSAGPTSAASAASAASHPVVDASINVHFDLKTGQMPENVVLDRNGSVDVTFAGARQVARISADGKTRILATLPAPSNTEAKTPLLGFPVTTGLVRDGKTFYVAYATGTKAETGIWKFTEGKRPSKLADLPAKGLPNGMAMDRRTGILYVSDSAKGAVYAVRTKGADAGKTRVFSSDQELAPAGYFGANGVKIRDRQLYISNLDKGTVVRSPLSGPRAGKFETVATGLKGIDDFAFTGKGNQLLAGLVTENKVVLVNGSGAQKTVLTSDDGLSNPTSVAVRATTVYVPSAAYVTQKDPNLLVAHLAR